MTMATRQLQEIELRLQEALLTLKEKNKSKQSVNRPSVLGRRFSYDGMGRRVSKSKYARRLP